MHFVEVRCLDLSISGLYRLTVSLPHRLDMMMVTAVAFLFSESSPLVL